MSFADTFNTSLVDYSEDFNKSDKIYAIKDWLKKHAKSRNKNRIAYDITPDFKINVKSDCIIIKENRQEVIDEFPEFIQFGTCKGSFCCHGIGLTKLRGCPKTVYGDFDCSNNNLTTLEGGPEILMAKKNKKTIEKLREHFSRSNRVLSNKDEYEPIQYNCGSNRLVNFIGHPKNTKNCTFNCYNNPIHNMIYKKLTEEKFEHLIIGDISF